MGCVIRFVISFVAWLFVMGMLFERNIPPTWRPAIAIFVFVGLFIFSFLLPIGGKSSETETESTPNETTTDGTTWEDRELRAEATWSNWWDEDGNKHRILSNTKPSGQVVVYEDKIVKYADIPAWGNSKLKKK